MPTINFKGEKKNNFKKRIHSTPKNDAQKNHSWLMIEMIIELFFSYRSYRIGYSINVRVLYSRSQFLFCNKMQWQVFDGKWLESF